MQHTVDRIKSHALTLGFCTLGITKQHIPTNYRHYLDWVNRGYHQNMWYLAETSRKQKRASAKHLLPNVNAIVVVAMSYHQKLPHPSNVKFARYGWGLDYHDFVKDKLRQLQSYMHNELALTFDAKIVVDTAPILEKDFAQQAGVGWMGKNTLIMNQKNGSYLYLGLLLTSLDLPEDKPTSAHCGTCTACLDACPTNAFEAPFLLNSAKCISYHTIENKNEDIPAALQPHLDGWIAGCDICQEVCPWNNKAHVTDSKETQARQHTYLQPEQIDKLAPSDHKKIFAQTAFSRIALPKLQQNVKAAMEKDASIKESQKKV